MTTNITELLKSFQKITNVKKETLLPYKIKKSKITIN